MPFRSPPGTETPPREPVVTLPEGEYALFLAQKAAEIADQRSRSREIQWRSFAGLVVTVLAVLGFSNLSSLKSDLRDLLKADVRDQVATTVDQYVSTNLKGLVSATMEAKTREFDARFAAAQFATLAVQISAAPAVNAADRDAANALLAEAIKSDQVTQMPQFRRVLEQLVDAYHEADLEADLDRVHEVLESVALETPGIAFTMGRHYGMRAIGAAEPDPEVLARFRQYVKANARHGTDVATIPFRIALAMREKGAQREQAVARLLDDVRHGPLKHRPVFVDDVHTLAGFKRSDTPNGKYFRIGETFTAFTTEYRSDLEDMPDAREPAEAKEAEDALERELLRDEHALQK